MSALDGATNIAIARRILTRLLEQADKETPALDARLLIGHVLNLDHTAMASNPERTLSMDERVSIARFAERRLAGEPVARILGHREFWGLPFALSKATLVPRPETETIVEAALDALGGRRNDRLRILDLGTGTGALLLALLHELKNASGIGTDLDTEAIATAQANAQALGLIDRAEFLRQDFSTGLALSFDLVVSNPPYIPTQHIEALAPEVREHDPKLALDGGTDGLDAYRTIAKQLPALLAAEGTAVLEIGIGQASDVEAIFHASGFALREARPDLAEIVRALVFMRR
ncbi:MAG: peptide chain release factor N(5)-glutamine methyltransferase [Pseudorhodoplanes sp.]